MGQRKGQTGNPNGRPKGSKNVVNAEYRENVTLIMEKHLPKLDKALEEMPLDKFVEAYVKLMPWVLSRLADTAGNPGEPSPLESLLNSFKEQIKKPSGEVPVS